jgi:hypothetical protein
MPGPSVTMDDSPVPYVTLYREPATLQGDESGWRSTYTFGVEMQYHDDFCVFLAGSPVVIDLGGGTSATRIIPCSDPYRADLLCRRISSVATGGFTPANHEAIRNWSHAKVTAEFASVPYAVDGSTPFMTIRSTAAPEAVTAAGKRLKFPDGTPISADASTTFPTEMHAVTIFNAVDNAPADAALTATYSGTVNNATLMGIYPAYTVRFDGMDRQTTRTATGVISVQKTYYLAYRSIDWRKLMKGDFTWDFAVKPDTTYMYSAVNYNPLFA